MAESDVIRLANDIAAQFGHLDDEVASQAVAAHLRSYWSPAMRAQLATVAGDQRLSSRASLAAQVLETT